MTRIEFNNQVLLISRKLYLVAFRFLKRQDEAEDAVQEIFMRLWNKHGELGRYDSLEALAIASVKNYCIDILRRKKLMMTEDHNNHSALRDNAPSPDEALEESDTSIILNKIIQSLPELYRTIITMKEIDGFSYEEISRATGQNVNNLRVSLSRARKMIRDEFKKYKYEYTGNIHSSR